MLQAKESFESAANNSHRYDDEDTLSLSPWPLDTLAQTVLQQLLRSTTPTIHPFPPMSLQTWVCIGLNLDYYVPGEAHLFLDTDNTDKNNAPVISSLAWQQFHLALIDVCQSQDILGAFLLSLFCGNTGAASLLERVVSSIPNPHHAHSCQFAKVLLTEYSVVISENGVHRALTACFRAWPQAELGIEHVALALSSDDTLADLAERYGHPWLEQWLRDWPSVICAGGAIVNSMRDLPPAHASDVDLFVATHDDWLRAAKHLQTMMPTPCPVVTQGAVVTWLCPAGSANVQLIYSLFDTPGELVSRFDLDYVQAWWGRGAGGCTGACAAAQLAGEARSTTPTLVKRGRLVKAADKGFAVPELTEEDLAAIRHSSAYKDSLHKHLQEIAPGSDAARALHLVRLMHRDTSYAEVHESVHAALATGFVPVPFGQKRATATTRQNDDALQFGEYPTDAAVVVHEAPSPFFPPSENLAPEVTSQHAHHFFRIAVNNAHADGHCHLRHVIPAIQIQPGPLLCPFGDGRLNQKQILTLNISGNLTPRALLSSKQILLFERLQQLCTRILARDECAESFLCERRGYVDLSVVRDHRTVFLDAQTNMPIDNSREFPSGTLFDATFLVERLMNISGTPLTNRNEVPFNGQLRMTYAKVTLPPSVIHFE
jgi:hypothetical protein